MGLSRSIWTPLGEPGEAHHPASAGRGELDPRRAGIATSGSRRAGRRKSSSATRAGRAGGHSADPRCGQLRLRRLVKLRQTPPAAGQKMSRTRLFSRITSGLPSPSTSASAQRWAALTGASGSLPRAAGARGRRRSPPPEGRGWTAYRRPGAVGQSSHRDPSPRARNRVASWGPRNPRPIPRAKMSERLRQNGEGAQPIVVVRAGSVGLTPGRLAQVDINRDLAPGSRIGALARAVAVAERLPPSYPPTGR